jgi:hypothetical protein
MNTTNDFPNKKIINLQTILLLVSVIDLLFLIFIFCVPTTPFIQRFFGDWFINWALIFAAISICVFISVIIKIFNDIDWFKRITKIHFLYIALITGYVSFAFLYIWNLIGRGI